MKKIKKILIVCTGNSCRSIMAEGYLSKRLNDMSMKDAIVISSGTGTIPGLKPSPETVEIMKEEGIDVSGYVSSSLSRTHIENADIILVMEPRHRDRILGMAPAAKDKIHLLREFSFPPHASHGGTPQYESNGGAEKKDENNSISDPIGKPAEFYREVFSVIKDSINGFVAWLKE